MIVIIIKGWWSWGSSQVSHRLCSGHCQVARDDKFPDKAASTKIPVFMGFVFCYYLLKSSICTKQMVSSLQGKTILIWLRLEIFARSKENISPKLRWCLIQPSNDKYQYCTTWSLSLSGEAVIMEWKRGIFWQVLVEAEPGDLILWDSRLIHGGRTGLGPMQAHLPWIQIFIWSFLSFRKASWLAVHQLCVWCHAPGQLLRWPKHPRPDQTRSNDKTESFAVSHSGPPTPAVLFDISGFGKAEASSKQGSRHHPLASWVQVLGF